MPSKKVMQKKAKELLYQLFLNQSDQDYVCEAVSDQNTRIVQEKTISEKLEKNFIQESTCVTSKKLPNISSFIDKELRQCFCSNRGSNSKSTVTLQYPTDHSTTFFEVERAFSTAGLFITKLRSHYHVFII